MKRYEYKEINNQFVRKEAHPIHRNRDGYAKMCYAIYADKEHMANNCPIARCYTMAEVKELTKI